MSHNGEEYQSTESDAELTEILGLADTCSCYYNSIAYAQKVSNIENIFLKNI